MFVVKWMAEISWCSLGHGGLLNKLLSYGIIETKQVWFSNYLFNRSQTVNINNTLSNCETIFHRVPKDSIIGSLFIIVSLTISLKTFPTQKLPNKQRIQLFSRYVDDIFYLFENEHQALTFLNFANNKQLNLNFITEKEHIKQLPFLDVLDTRSDRFITSVYKESTFIGLSAYNPLHRDFSRSYFDFYKRKERKDFKGSFPDYTLPAFTTYKLLKGICIFGETFLFLS